jgi:hypothetical protein
VEYRRLLSQSGRGATRWLRAIPTSHRGKVRNIDFRICFQIWLHLPLPCLMAAFHNDPEPPCHCWQHGTTEPAIADRRGDHDMVCRNCNKLWRHNGILRGLEAAARLANLNTNRVVLGIDEHLLGVLPAANIHCFPAFDINSPGVLLAAPATPSVPTPVVLARPLERAQGDPAPAEPPTPQARRRATHRACVACLEQLVESDNTFR